MKLTQEQQKQIEVAIKVLTETLTGDNTVGRMTIAQSCFTLKAMIQPPRKKITKNQVRVSTSDFVLTHGKAPRGIGGWYFYFPRCNHKTESAPRGTYTESKKWAINRAAELGTTLVEVCS